MAWTSRQAACSWALRAAPARGLRCAAELNCAHLLSFPPPCSYPDHASIVVPPAPAPAQPAATAAAAGGGAAAGEGGVVVVNGMAVDVPALQRRLVSVGGLGVGSRHITLPPCTANCP